MDRKRPPYSDSSHILMETTKRTISKFKSRTNNDDIAGTSSQFSNCRTRNGVTAMSRTIQKLGRFTYSGGWGRRSRRIAGGLPSCNFTTGERTMQQPKAAPSSPHTDKACRSDAVSVSIQCPVLTFFHSKMFLIVYVHNDYF